MNLHACFRKANSPMVGGGGVGSAGEEEGQALEGEVAVVEEGEVAVVEEEGTREVGAGVVAWVGMENGAAEGKLLSNQGCVSLPQALAVQGRLPEV